MKRLRALRANPAGFEPTSRALRVVNVGRDRSLSAGMLVCLHDGALHGFGVAEVIAATFGDVVVRQRARFVPPIVTAGGGRRGAVWALPARVSAFIADYLEHQKIRPEELQHGSILVDRGRLIDATLAEVAA